MTYFQKRPDSPYFQFGPIKPRQRDTVAQIQCGIDNGDSYDETKESLEEDIGMVPLFPFAPNLQEQKMDMSSDSEDCIVTYAAPADASRKCRRRIWHYGFEDYSRFEKWVEEFECKKPQKMTERSGWRDNKERCKRALLVFQEPEDANAFVEELRAKETDIEVKWDWQLGLYSRVKTKEWRQAQKRLRKIRNGKVGVGKQKGWSFMNSMKPNFKNFEHVKN